MRHVLLVGATDGIGLALARAYLKREWRVALLGRDPAKVARVADELRASFPGCVLVTGTLDLGMDADPAPALDGAVRELGQVDLIIHCAGVMEREDRLGEMLDVNVRGALRVLRWGARRMAEAGEGHLAALGSVAGDRGRRGNPAYGATKAALHTYLDGLRHELHGRGVRVTTVKPGWVRTRMLGEVPAFPPAATPEAAAEAIVRGIQARREVLYVPGWWRWISLALRALPAGLFKRVAPP